MTTDAHGRPWHCVRSFMALLWHYHGMTMYDHGITMDDHGIAMHYLGTSMVCSRFAIVRCLVQTPQS